ncbi:helix-turn-helix transcriptional regulator [Bacillaceae bacterium IKA-2]|nr:helix-turn-helix transcriptional regulator [Bacillaceae bacterium IKA-2]
MNFIKKLFKKKPNNVTVSVTSYTSIPKPISLNSVYTGEDFFSIRKNILEIKRDKKLTQKQLSDCLGFKSNSFVSKLERCEMQKIDHEHVDKLANCLNVEISQLLIGEEKI